MAKQKSKRVSYVVTISTKRSDLGDLLCHLKKTRRLGVFISTCLESFCDSESGKRLVKVFHPAYSENCSDGDSLGGESLAAAPAEAVDQVNFG